MLPRFKVDECQDITGVSKATIPKLSFALIRSFLELVQDLDYGMQDKAKVGEKAQHTGVFEHFESTFNAVMCPLARP